MPSAQNTHETLNNNDSDQSLAAFDAEEACKYYVTDYQVVMDQGNVSGIPLSCQFATQEQAKAALTVIKKQQPTAKIRCATYLFSSEDEPGRAEILASIVQPDG